MSLPSDDGAVEPEPTPEHLEATEPFAHERARRAVQARARGEHRRALRIAREHADDPVMSREDRALASLLVALSLRDAGEDAAAANAFRELRIDAGEETHVLSPLRGDLRLAEARALNKLGELEAAVEAVEAASSELSERPELRAEFDMLKARLAQRSGNAATARETYEALLADPGALGASDRHGLRLELGSLWSADDPSRAREHYLKIIRESPASGYGQKAWAALEEGELLKPASGLAAGKAKEIVRERNLGLGLAKLKRRDYDQAFELGARYNFKRESAQTRCLAAYIQGSARFKQRKRGEARPYFLQAAKSCAKAGDVDHEVKARYQGARGAYAMGKPELAAKEFKALAKDHARHSYADDAWIKSGEAWELAGDLNQAQAAWREALKRHPEGDMRSDAQRRLLREAFRASDWAAVESLTREGEAGTHGKHKAKMVYFRARAEAAQGKKAEALASYGEVLAIAPLSYPGLQALSRISELDESHYQSTLSVLDAPTSEAPQISTALPSGLAMQRAWIWGRLGEEAAAKAELDRQELSGWPVVHFWSEVGLHAPAQRELANLGSVWRERPPGQDLRDRWQEAHPLPFSSIIREGERARGMPDFLTYGIMQTESRFEPTAVSWAGARGLVQLMPATAEETARREKVKYERSRLFEPAYNLRLGQAYLSRLLGRWDRPTQGLRDGVPALAVPSYNAGPGAVDRWLKERGDWDLDLWVEAIPYDETRHYVQTVLGRWWAYRWIYGEGDPAERAPYLPLKIPSRAP